MATSKSLKQTEDLISNVLDILPDKILELLPIRDAARTSVLSKQWRLNWLSLKHLDFDYEFFVEVGRRDWQECSNIISSVLLHHNGPIHNFILYIPDEANEECKYLPQWIFALSKAQVKCVSIWSEVHCRSIPSYIFSCSELIYLELDNCIVHSPPSGFSGFPKLRHLSLGEMGFSKEDIFLSLMAKCRKLVSLKLMRCWGMGHIFIDVPSLEMLTISSDSELEPVAFGDVCNLRSIALHLHVLGKLWIVETIEALNTLACLRQLQCIELGGDFFKVLAAASIKRPLPFTFNHLNKLTLDLVDLSSLDVVLNISNMVDRCPYMKELVISVRVHSGKNVNPQKLDYTKFHKSPHLLELKISGITGSGVEIQLIEYLLTIAVALDKLFYKSYDCDTESQLKLSKILSEIPRASPKARVVCLT